MDYRCSRANIYNNIKFLRLTRNVTQEEVAAMLNMSRSSYSALERGLRELSFETALRISIIYSIALEALALPFSELDESSPVSPKDSTTDSLGKSSHVSLGKSSPDPLGKSSHVSLGKSSPDPPNSMDANDREAITKRPISLPLALR